MSKTNTQVSVGTSTPALLWQTSTGVSPDPQTTAAGNATPQIFRAGTFNDPVNISITNTDATNPIFFGGPNVTSGTGIKVAAGATVNLPPVIGNDSMYAISTGGTVVVNVAVGPGN